ncbi:MAG: HEPN domain-containing protein [bacterium]
MDREYIDSLWQRAVFTLGSAKINLIRDSDLAANRAYYAAFYAVSALFAGENRFFKKHSGVRSAVYAELVHTGRWKKELGDDYRNLMELREVADYGVLQHATKEEAQEAIDRSERILIAVHEAQPDIFPLDAQAEHGKSG